MANVCCSKIMSINTSTFQVWTQLQFLQCAKLISQFCLQPTNPSTPVLLWSTQRWPPSWQPPAPASLKAHIGLYWHSLSFKALSCTGEHDPLAAHDLPRGHLPIPMSHTRPAPCVSPAVCDGWTSLWVLAFSSFRLEVLVQSHSGILDN